MQLLGASISGHAVLRTAAAEGLLAGLDVLQLPARTAVLLCRFLRDAEIQAALQQYKADGAVQLLGASISSHAVLRTAAAEGSLADLGVLHLPAQTAVLLCRFLRPAEIQAAQHQDNAAGAGRLRGWPRHRHPLLLTEAAEASP